MRIAFLLLLAVCGISNAATLRWLGFSDIHYGSASYEAGEPEHNFAWATNVYNPSFALFTGDNFETSTNNIPAFITATETLGCPRYFIKGNHESATEWSTWFPVNFCFTNGNYKFIGVIGKQSPLGNGMIEANELTYLWNNMTNSSQYNLVVSTHWPVIAEIGNIDPGYGLEELTNYLTGFNAVLYIHGHRHQCDFMSNKVNGVTFTVQNPSLYDSCTYGGFNAYTLSGTTLKVERIVASSVNGYTTNRTMTLTVPEYIDSIVTSSRRLKMILRK